MVMTCITGFNDETVGTWDGYIIKRENNISWSKNPGYNHSNNEYKMNRRRRNGI